MKIETCWKQMIKDEKKLWIVSEAETFLIIFYL